MAQRFKYVLSRKIQNDLISKHNGYKGGDLDVPIIPNTVTQQSTEQPAPTTPTTPPATPATPIVQASTLPETAQDWKNMTDDELLKITPDDIINNLSEASFRIAFRQASTANPPGSFAIGQAIEARLFNNLNGNVNPNRMALIEASHKRWDLISWWIPETDPLFNTTLQGIPKYWFKHYNQYSWVSSQVIMYNTYQDFQDTSFYRKFGSRVVTIKPPKKFARYMSGSNPGLERVSLGMGNSGTYLHNIFEKYGQKWRVMFFEGDMSGVLTSGNDYYVYYIDCTDLNDYLDMLEEFYNDRDTLQPQEVIIMLSIQYQASVRKHERELIAQGYSQGEADQKAKDDAEKEAAEAAEKQTSDDNSDSIWGTIGSVALDVLPFLL